jgi:hypothetical protein
MVPELKFIEAFVELFNINAWISISIAGAAFALNSLLKLVGVHLIIKDIIYNYYLVELSQIIFLISFIYAVLIWFQFINKTNHNDFLST